MRPDERAAVIGAGSWGTALAFVLARAGLDAALWARAEDHPELIAARRENSDFLPGFPLPDGVRVTGDLAEALHGARLVFLAAPSPWFRGACRLAAPHLPPAAICVSVAKGIEEGSLRRMSEVMGEELPGSRRAVLSGPSFATEVAQGHPTAVVVASDDELAARQVQQALSGPRFRLYTNPDVAGVELGGAVKNVVAIAAGAVEGLGLGSNTMAALVTRGLAEMRRLAVALGARPDTLSGLSGLGDLVLTCTGALSRNRQIGIRLAKGEKIGDIVGSMRMVAEGVRTTRSVTRLAANAGVEVPIAATVEAILHQGKSIPEALEGLMARAPKEEFWG